MPQHTIADKDDKVTATEPDEQTDYAEANFANGLHIEAARAAASSARRKPGDAPAPVDARTGHVSQPRPGMKVESGIITEGPFRPHMSLDPRYVEAIDGWEEFKGYLQPARHALSAAQVGLEQIANARAHADKNQAWNDYQKLLVVSEASEKKQEQITKAFDSAFSNLTKAVRAH